MTDYISREDALNFEMEIEADPDEIQAISKGMALYGEYIKSIPAAEVVAQKSGKWEVYDFHSVKCSFCEFVMDIMTVDSHVLNHMNYCPNCGALMEVSATDED